MSCLSPTLREALTRKPQSRTDLGFLMFIPPLSRVCWAVQEHNNQVRSNKARSNLSRLCFILQQLGVMLTGSPGLLPFLLLSVVESTQGTVAPSAEGT